MDDPTVATGLPGLAAPTIAGEHRRASPPAGHRAGLDDQLVETGTHPPGRGRPAGPEPGRETAGTTSASAPDPCTEARGSSDESDGEGDGADAPAIGSDARPGRVRRHDRRRPGAVRPRAVEARLRGAAAPGEARTTGRPASPTSRRRCVTPSLGTRRPQYASKGHGWTAVLTPDRREMLAQGLLEGKVMLGLLACPWVVRIVEQPEAVEYVDEDGVPRRHTFDLFVETVDALRFLIEVKPSKIAVRDGIDDHLSVIASYVGRDRADGVALVTELQVPRVVMHDAQLIASSRMHPDPAADERLLAALPAEGATLADLGVATGLKGSAVRAAARLLGAGVLAKSLPQRIGPDLVVVRAGVRGR